MQHCIYGGGGYEMYPSRNAPPKISTVFQHIFAVKLLDFFLARSVLLHSISARRHLWPLGSRLHKWMGKGIPSPHSQPSRLLPCLVLCTFGTSFQRTPSEFFSAFSQQCSCLETNNGCWWITVHLPGGWYYIRVSSACGFVDNYGHITYYHRRRRVATAATLSTPLISSPTGKRH